MHRGNLPQNTVDSCQPEEKAARGTPPGGNRSLGGSGEGQRVKAYVRPLVQAAVPSSWGESAITCPSHYQTFVEES